MPTYIALLKWTPQGLQNLKESPSRESARDCKRSSVRHTGRVGIEHCVVARVHSNALDSSDSGFPS
jgi:hypothetical protein